MEIIMEHGIEPGIMYWFLANQGSRCNSSELRARGVRSRVAQRASKGARIFECNLAADGFETGLPKAGCVFPDCLGFRV